MASDMVVALAPATPDRRTLFGHNCNAPQGTSAVPVREPGRDFSPGERVRSTRAPVPQVRHTHAFVGSRLPDTWGCPHGVNERGVALGCTSILTRLHSDGPGLTGPELVRLGLERAASAYQAVEVLTDLTSRHGLQGGTCFLIADATEAVVLEAGGHHWALGHVGSVRAAGPACVLRQDWDRLSRGLSDLAIGRGWWPADGCKLDFAGAVGLKGPDQLQAMRRWGHATMLLEEHSGDVTHELIRRVLHDQADALVSQGRGKAVTACTFVARVGAGEAPVAWWAVGEPAAGIYLPVFPFADLPEALAGVGDWLDLWQEARPPGALRPALASLQHRLDAYLAEVWPEVNALYRRGDAEALRRLTASFMQHCVERLEDLADQQGLSPGEAERLRGPHTAAMVPGGTF